MRIQLGHVSLAGLAVILGAAVAWGGPVTTDLYFTAFNVPAGTKDVNKVTFTFNGTTATYSAVTGIASVPGADGIVFAPNGTLLIGGGTNDVIHNITNLTTGAFTDASTVPGTHAFHEAVDPTGQFVYAGNIPLFNQAPNRIAKVPLVPFANGTSIAVSGDDSMVAGIAFDNTGQAYYTNGAGNFGKVNLTTGVTTRLRTGLASAEGIAWDPFTLTFILSDGSTIEQLNTAGTTLSTLVVGASGGGLDQGSVDGAGHLWVASNNGTVTFIDYSAGTHLIGNGANFVNNQFLMANLDDLAPLSGPGSNTTPEPATFVLIGGALVGFGFHRMRSRRVS